MDPSKIGSYKNFLYLNEELKKYVAFDYIPQSGGALVNLDFVSIEPDAEDHLQSMLP